MQVKCRHDTSESACIDKGRSLYSRPLSSITCFLWEAGLESVVDMETDRNQTYTNEQKQKSNDIALSVRFLENNTLTSQEIDLVRAALEEIMLEMRHLEQTSIAATISCNEGDPSHSSDDEYRLITSSTPPLPTGTERYIRR